MSRPLWPGHAGLVETAEIPRTEHPPETRSSKSGARFGFGLVELKPGRCVRGARHAPVAEGTFQKMASLRGRGRASAAEALGRLRRSYSAIMPWICSRHSPAAPPRQRREALVHLRRAPPFVDAEDPEALLDLARQLRARGSGGAGRRTGRWRSAAAAAAPAPLVQQAVIPCSVNEATRGRSHRASTRRGGRGGRRNPVDHMPAASGTDLHLVAGQEERAAVAEQAPLPHPRAVQQPVALQRRPSARLAIRSRHPCQLLFVAFRREL